VRALAWLGLMLAAFAHVAEIVSRLLQSHFFGTHSLAKRCASAI
jgi:hypothetical protein